MKRFFAFLLGVLLAALPALPSASGGYEQAAERSAVVVSAGLQDQYRPQNAQVPPDQFALFTLPFWQGTNKTLVDLLDDGNTKAWYQPGVGVTGTLNASAWADQSGNGNNLLQATGANQPIVLPWTANYAYLPAVAGNTLTSPNQTVIESQTITFDIALNDYTPAADVTLFAKVSGNDGFSVLWLTTDKIRLVIGDGVGLTNVDVVAASGFTDGSRHTVTIAWADGVGATFSYDGVQSGSQVAAAKTLTNAAVVMTVGSTTSIGKAYRIQVGSLYDMNAAIATETTTNGATFAGGAGETWTLNNTGALLAQVVGSPQLLFDGIAHTMQSAAFTLNQPFTVYFLGKQVTWTSVDLLWSGLTTNGLSFYQHPFTPDIRLYAGTNDIINSNFAVNTVGILTGVFDGASSSLAVNAGATVTGSSGSNNINGLTLGSNNNASQYANMQVKEWILRSVADSAATRLAIQQALAFKHNLTPLAGIDWMMPRYAWLPAANDDEYLLRAGAQR